MSIRKYQTAGPKKTTPKKLSMHPDISNSINRVDSIFPGAKDLMSYTAMAESTGGQNPNAGQNYFQIMQEGLDAVKDTKSHPDLIKKLQIVKDKFGLDIANMDLSEVRTNPLANTIVARLYYMNDKNPIPKTQEGMAKYWADYYNTSLDKHGTPEYFNKAVSQFDYKAASEPAPEPKKETSWWRGEEGFIPNEIQDPLEKHGLWPFQSGGQRQMGGSMMSNPSMYQQMQQLPGGTMQQIPGSDAVEFRGQTHKQGGILMDAETEVEDGETMDKVTMKNGQNEDYFFSSYLKKGGRTYSDMHKEILSRGGNQGEINYLAAMQEKAAKRSPNKIAKMGGVMQYEDGGMKKKEIRSFQKQRYEDERQAILDAIAADFSNHGGKGKELRLMLDNFPKTFKEWNKANPFSQEDYNKNYGAGAEEVVDETTVGLRQELDSAYGYSEGSGDGYTICQSGNCQDGTGVMYTYYDAGEDSKEVIAMYEGEFKDGSPIGQGKFTWNDVNAAEDQNVEFIASSNFEVGEFNIDKTGHPNLVSGTQDYGETGVKTGIFTNNNLKNSLISGTETYDGVTTNYEDGEEIKKFSKDARKNLENLGLLEAIPFKYSQGEINPKYKKMKDYGTYTQATEKELNELGYSSHDEMRADYERLIDADYDWKKTHLWGEQHQNAFDALKAAKDFTKTGTYIPPEEKLEYTGTTREEKRKFHRDNPGYWQNCECDPTLAKGSIDCQECHTFVGEKGFKNTEEYKNSLKLGTEGEDDRDVNLDLGSAVPWETYLAAGAQLVPAAYALTHNQPDPEIVPFESGVTSPIVPGRLRAEKLSHINMNLQRSINDSNLREMNQYIDTSGGGPANMINRMAAWGQKHEGDMQIAAAEKQANIGISNQNVTVENQTNLHNLKMEQEAALGNAQMQQAEAQRLNEVNAINTAARNKIKDDEEYMKYAGIIAGAQGIGSLFGDMLSYKGDRIKAKGYGIMGTTERMFLRDNLGKTLYYENGDIFCENCTEEDIAKYYNASKKAPPVNPLIG